jgi:hypothetical protein
LTDVYPDQNGRRSARARPSAMGVTWERSPGGL